MSAIDIITIFIDRITSGGQPRAGDVPRYNKAAAELAWKRTIDFFERQLN